MKRIDRKMLNQMRVDLVRTVPPHSVKYNILTWMFDHLFIYPDNTFIQAAHIKEP